MLNSTLPTARPIFTTHGHGQINTTSKLTTNYPHGSARCLLNTLNYMLQYRAKLMKTLIDEYRQNRDISAILFGTKKKARYFGTSLVPVVARFRRVVCDISLPVSEISLPLSEILFTLSEKSLSLSEISLSLKEKLLPLNELSLALTEKLMNMVSYVSPHLNKIVRSCVQPANADGFTAVYFRCFLWKRMCYFSKRQ